MIYFYTLKECPYCKIAKKDLKREIEQGKVIIRDAKQAPRGATAFPYFVNSENRKVSSGWRGKKDLFEKLN